MLRSILRLSLFAMLAVVTVTTCPRQARGQAAISLSPGVAATFAGDTTGNCPQSPDTYTGPVASNWPTTCGLVLYEPTSVVTDAQGDVFILTTNLAQSGTIVFVVASGKGPIPSLASVPNPQANTIYPLAGQGDSGCANPLDSYGDGCLATQSTFVTGIAGLSLDVNGNLYIADSNDYLVRVVYAGGVVPGLTNLTAGYIYALNGNFYDGNSGPNGVAVDLYGNVYVAENTNEDFQVIYAGGLIPGLPPNPVPGSAYVVSTASAPGRRPCCGAAPFNMLVDPLGNVYFSGNVFNGSPHGYVWAMYSAGALPGVSNPSYGQIYIIAGNGGNASGPQNGILASNAAVGGHPYQIAMDAVGNLYIPDSDDGYVLKVDPTGNLTTVFGTPQPGCSFGATDTLGDGCTGQGASLVSPFSVALDPSGNLFIADQGSNLIRELNVLTSELYFGSQKVGTTSPVQTVTVTNTGSAPLIFTAITASSQFAQAPSGGVDCSTTQSVAPGASCEIGVVYAPTQSGSPTGTITISSNAGNAVSGAVISIIGTTLFTSTTALAITAPPSVIVGQNVTLTATVSSLSGAPPTGTVSFSIGSTSYGTSTLTNGVATLTTNQLPYGSNTILAAYSGDANNRPSSGQLLVSLGPGVQLAVSPSDITLQAGKSQTVMLTITGFGNPSLTMTVACQGTTPGITCSPGTSTLGPGQPLQGSIQVPLKLTALPVLNAQSRGDGSVPLPFNVAFLLPGAFGLVILPFRRRFRFSKRTSYLCLAFLLFSGAFTLTSCNSGGSSTAPPHPTQQTVVVNVVLTTYVNGFLSNAVVSTSFQATVQ